MFARAVNLFAATIIWMIWNQSIALGAPTPTGDSILVLNQQIASMILPTTAPRPLQPLGPARHYPLGEFSSRTAVDHSKPVWLTDPTLLLIATHFTSAERILHYRHAGFDANLWGVFNRGRGIRVRLFFRL
jgi:hypothetical protein